MLKLTHAVSHSSTSSTTLVASTVSWDWGAVFDTADLEVGTNEGSDGSVTTLAIDTTAAATVGSDLDVEGSDATGLDDFDQLLGSLHGGVWRWLVQRTLDDLTTRDATDGFGAGDISDVDESIVLRGKDVDGGENLLVVGLLWKIDDIVVHLLDNLGWCRHQKK